MNIDFTQGEVNALLQLIDLAVKANGLQVAEASLTLHKKIVEAINKEKAVNVPEEKK